MCIESYGSPYAYYKCGGTSNIRDHTTVKERGSHKKDATSRDLLSNRSAKEINKTLSPDSDLNDNSSKS